MKTVLDPRHQARRLALIKIYEKEISEKSPDTNIINYISELKIKNFDKNLYTKIVNGVDTTKPNLLKTIDNCKKDLNVNNMFLLDLLILYIAIWELNYTNTPSKVIIDEAIELAKEFSTDNSSKFINGLLSEVIKNK